MQNIELKARYLDLRAAEKIAREIGARFVGVLQQTDTYFRVMRGRLKIREINSEESQLIFYERPDEAAGKLSTYFIYPAQSPEELKSMLQAALGIWCVVKKRRKLYLYDEVRIHLDLVEELGAFIEFEGVLSDAGHESETREKVEWLTSKFGIADAELVKGSYLDLTVTSGNSQGQQS